MSLSVRPLRADDHAAWNAFVESHERGTFFHLAEWSEVLRRSFGHRPYYLLAENDGVITGVLPLARNKSLLFGDALVSTPFCVYGGMVADDAESGQALRSEAERLARELGVDHLELRNRELDDCAADDDGQWHRKELYVTFRKAISDDADANLKAIPRKQRAMVRKGIKAGLDYVIEDDTARFFSAYSESVRNLGTPVFSPRYFRVLRDVFGDRCEVLTVQREGELVASVMSFYFRDEVLPYYGGGVAAARQLKGNDYMYYALMNHAAQRGARLFDYGRSKAGAGSYSFKKNWGFEPEPLYYEYYLVKAAAVPDLNPNNPKYRLMIDLWKRLPLPLSRVLGPMISGALG
ncbi:MAG: FemAB family XrtA/PEP-CTERM system-associated protein [Gammaproteobacteria bacterium]